MNDRRHATTAAMILAACVLGSAAANADIDLRGRWVGRVSCPKLLDASTNEFARRRVDATLDFDANSGPSEPGVQFGSRALYDDLDHGPQYFDVSMNGSTTPGVGLVSLNSISDPPACTRADAAHGFLVLKANKLRGTLYFVDSFTFWGACKATFELDTDAPVPAAYCP
jgi:hypothetical protein